MLSKCGFKFIFMSIIFIIIVSGYAKDISGVERGHNRLNEYISHYETLNYDQVGIAASHNRAKRSVTKDHFVHLKFAAHGRSFHLRLKRDLKTFSDKLEIYDSRGPIAVSTDHIYEGDVVGERNSYVFGSIMDGVFQGKIITARDAYYVEHAKHYFPANRTMQPMALRRTSSKLVVDDDAISSAAVASEPTTNDTTKTTSTTQKPTTQEENATDFHSVIYKDAHVEDVYEDMREGHVAGCGITDEVSQWMENIQNSAVEELPEPMSKDVKDEPNKKSHKKSRASALRMSPQNDTDAKHMKRQDNLATTTTKTTDAATNNNVPNQAKSSTNNGSKAAATANQTTTTSQSQQQHTPPHPPKKYSNTNNAGGTGNDDFKYPYQKYSKEANYRFEPTASAAAGTADDSGSPLMGTFYDPETGRKYAPSDNDWHERVHARIRRAAATNAAGRREDNKNTCSLYIQTDPLIWRHIREGIADHERIKYERDVKTREEITSLIAHHVTAVNYIYRNTKFDGRSEHRNIRFEVQRIKIDDDTACRSTYNGPHNAFCNEHMDVSNFLNLHSLEDHSDFCLAYVFTYRDFTGGTLGLAWVASASGASGGICEKYKTYTETVGGQYQSTKRSLNTGIITFVNYNSRVPPKVSQLTLAHEIGHNFGSPHDYPQECRPGGLNGNFIMFASATSGDRPNNSKFSPCSIRNISNVLDVLVGNLKRDCFKAYEGAFCGNKIVELGEECDCGFNEEECNDKCCYPRIINEYDLSVNGSARGCTRRAKTQCSPSQGPCCMANSCAFVTSNKRQKCKEETECSWSSTCNGTTAECPEPKPRDDKTKCNNGTALCIRGDCSGSICLLWNMSECFLTSQAVPHVDKRKLCELACQNGNDTNTCRSTSEFAHLFGLPDGGISLRPGSPCDNFQGYCDVFLKCRAVDADGPLLRLKNLLLNRETLLTVAQWITENWYIVVLLGIGFILVMGVFIKCCAVHTPSSNPKKRRARRISETLRAPMNTLRRMRHPHGRGAGPRSIPPPAQDARLHHRSHMPEWDRRGAAHAHRHGVAADVGAHAVVAYPAATAAAASSNTHASRAVAAASGRPAAGARSSRNSAQAAGNSSRQPSSSRAGYAYAERVPPPAFMGGASAGVGVTANAVGAGVVNITGIGGELNAAVGGAIARQQMLPMPSNAHTSQTSHAQQQAFYTPKENRNKSRSSRSSVESKTKKETQKPAKNRRNVIY